MQKLGGEVGIVMERKDGGDVGGLRRPPREARGLDGGHMTT